MNFSPYKFVEIAGKAQKCNTQTFKNTVFLKILGLLKFYEARGFKNILHFL